jgi:hypothetical protein
MFSHYGEGRWGVDRCALFVDAGYVLADGAMAVHGTRRRESVSWDYSGLLQLLAGQAMERSRLPLLRCYWYEATVEGQRSDDHEALADLPGVKLRVAKMWPGRREGAEIQRDLTTLARNKAVTDAMVVSAEENLAKVISDVQDMGMRVTLLNIAIDGETTVSRALRQECDDIVEISSAQLRPYVELIPGAEPARADERSDAPQDLQPAANGTANGTGAMNGAANGNGTGTGVANGNGNGGGAAERAVPYAQPFSLQEAVQRAAAPAYAAPSASSYAEYPEYPDYQRAPGPQEQAGSTTESAAAEPGTAAAAADADSQADGVTAGGQAGADSGYQAADYPGGSDQRTDYATATGYGPPAEYAAAPYNPGAVAPADAAPPRPEQPYLRQDAPVRPEPLSAVTAVPERAAAPQGQQTQQGQQSRLDYGLRRIAAEPETASRADAPVRHDLYAAPVAVPAAAETAVERQPAWPRPDTEPRPAESGYSPGAVREQFQPDTASREPQAGNGADRYQPQMPLPVPVPVGSAQVRRLPSRGPGQPGQVLGQPEPVPGSPLGSQAVMPAGPSDNRGQGYAGPRGDSYGAGSYSAGSYGAGSYEAGSYGGPRPLGPGPGGVPGAPGGMGAPGGPGGPSGFADQPNGAPPAGAPLPMPPSGLTPGPGVGPMPGQNPSQGQNQGQGQGQNPSQLPPSGPVSQVPPPPQGYSGGQSGVSLADAVQSAHEEGQAFGESVARDAPALWLEAVLARKPRMPSDLEARLLQGSALPIDFLLHDEVRHALRRGFWDALERARR